MHYVADTLVYKLHIARKQIEGIVREDFSELPITHENYATLHFIYENPGISQKDLATLNDKDKNSLAHVINRLEDNGYVERRRNDGDRRIVALYVTEAGKKLIRMYWKSFTKPQSDCFEDFTDKERETFIALLNKLIDHKN